jgi:hypothetical protein
MTLSRRSFLKGLAALPLVAAFLPKEVQASVPVYLTKGNSLGKTEFKKFGTESSRFDGKQKGGMLWETFTGDIPVGAIVCFDDEYGGKVRLVVGNEFINGVVVRKNVILMS